DILEKGLFSALANQNLGPSNIIFQPENNPKHTSKYVKAWLCDNAFDLLDWLPNSRD
ncbi:hypothetical protein C8J56DRAFT_795025, partial [Mycena floridula]